MTTTQSEVVKSVRWNLSPAGQGTLTLDDLNIAAHIEAGRAATIKHGQHRTVYRIELASGTIFWKHCRLNGSRAWWREILRGPKARLEYEKAVELAERGIDTIEPLAWGRFDQAWPKGSFLITRALEGTRPLDEFLADLSDRSPQERRSVTVALAHYVARLHKAGVTHPDLHPGNLLVRTEAAGLKFFLIDLHDIELGASLSPSECFDNLILLNRWFRMRATRADRLRFWIAYSGQGKAKDEARRIERATERSIGQLWASRDGRCLRENRHFRKLKGKTTTGFSMRELADPIADGMKDEPDKPFELPDAELLKDSRSATVCIVSLPGENGLRSAVFKRFRVTRWSDPFVDQFRPSAALRSWKNGHAFLDRGLPTPKPFLYLSRRRFGLTTTGYLLCERVENSRDLHDAIRYSDRAALWQLIDTLARWIRLMHERGASHRDLKAANILVSETGECWFIDLVGVRLQKSVHGRLCLRDLTRLNASFVFSPNITRTDRLRFLRTYLNVGLSGPANWKDWWKQIALATEVKVQRNSRKNRPLA